MFFLNWKNVFGQKSLQGRARTPGFTHPHLKIFSEENENENYIFYDADKTDVPSCHGVVPEL